MKRYWIAMAAGVLAAGCGVLPDAYSGCEKIRPYQNARQAPPLRVPSGADLPDTRNALKIPDITAPELPAESGRCLDHPPKYGTSAQREG
jgi:uncharacterized lipoprotein